MRAIAWLQLEKRREQAILLVVAALAIDLLSASGLAPAQAQPSGFADPAFKRVWERTDLPLAQGRVARSWVWGPVPGRTRKELFAEGPDGMHLVQYFDKARMEINNPNGNPSDPYFVTNGLLVVEMISGQLQTGVNRFVSLLPNPRAVAGDDNNDTPNYATLHQVSTLGTKERATPHTPGSMITPPYLTMLDGVRPSLPPDVLPPGERAASVEAGVYINETGRNIPKIFWDYLNSKGVVYEGGVYRTDTLVNWVSTFGYPITEPYWIVIQVSGAKRLVLFQAFERRTLTYSPRNPEGWKVEMGNVGAQYLEWQEEITPLCQVRMPSGGLLTFWRSHPNVWKRVGCPTKTFLSQPYPEGVDDKVATAYQPFERGAMLYVSRSSQPGQNTGTGTEQRPIYVMFNDGTFLQVEDSWRQGEPESGGLQPPAGLHEPMRGFGKVWREATGGNARERLGWATAPEQGGPGAVQRFRYGEVYWSSAPNRIFVFYGIDSNGPYPAPTPGPTGPRLIYEVYSERYQP